MKKNMVTDRIKALVRSGLADIGECINGAAIAYTRRKSVHWCMNLAVPSHAIVDCCFSEFSAAVLCGLVKEIEAAKFLHVREKARGRVLVVFRAMDIYKEGPNTVFYVRCAIEDDSVEEHEFEDYESIRTVDVI